MATYSGGNKGLIDLIGAENSFSPRQLEGTQLSQPSTVESSGWSGMSSANKMGAINAGMSTPGGIGDKLMSGGSTAALMGAGPAGWGVAAGGLVLSLIEAEQRKKAEEEAQRVAAENQKTENMKAQIGKLMNMKLGV